MSAHREISPSTARRRLGTIFAVAILIIVISASGFSAPPPLGDDNEVWLTTSSGDTICVGEEVELEYHLANSSIVTALELSLAMESQDGARWEWLQPPEAQGDLENISVVSGCRWEGIFDVFGADLTSHPALGGPVDSIELYAVDVDGDAMAPGPLEHMVSLHFRATEPGTICLDTICIPSCALDQWHFAPSGVHPAWAGPICFSVAESPVGDINCDGVANLADAIYIVNWIFKGGPEPCR
jgi:hypothetical protein